MKAITIDFYGQPANYILLENIDDVLEYADDLCHSVEEGAQRMIKSNLPPERFDHLCATDKVGNLIRGAVMKTQITGGASILELGHQANDKIQRMINCSLDGEQIMLNSMGGYCFLTDDTVILSKEDYEFTREPTHVIKDNTKFINLENDAMLEQHTIDHLSKIDPNFSHVCSLRNYSQSELIEVFKEFKSKGGESGYIYTTGFDITQVEEYCAAFQAAGITKIDFEFNAGIKPELQRTLDTLSEKFDITIKEV